MKDTRAVWNKKRLNFCVRIEKNVFSSCLSCSKKVKEFYISQKAGNAESVGFFNLQVCGLKEKWYLNIFIRSVTLQNGGFVTHPYPYWEQHPGSFAGLNATDSSTFTESLPSKAAHLGAWGWLHVSLRSHVRIQYQEEYSTCKETGKCSVWGSNDQNVNAPLKAVDSVTSSWYTVVCAAMQKNVNSLQLHHCNMVIVQKSKATWAG